MKNKVLALLVLGLLLSLLALPTLSQPQEQKSQLFYIVDVVARPANAMKFEAALKQENELGYPYPTTVYSSDDFHYYILLPIEGYAGIDKMNKAESDWMAKIGDKYQAILKTVEGAFESYGYGVIRLRPELSYVPKKPRVKPEEVKFLYWGMAYVEFSKIKEFEDIWKQWVDLFKSKACSMGFTMYSLEMGTDMPFYFWAVGGKSATEFWIADEKVSKMLGEDKTKELWNKTLACLRKYEDKTGMPRPDLSNTPKEK
jgi:hypothetical protein